MKVDLAIVRRRDLIYLGAWGGEEGANEEEERERICILSIFQGLGEEDRALS